MIGVRGGGLEIISGAIGLRLYFVLCSMLITLSLSRCLGAESFGRYVWFTSIAFFLSGLAQAGGNNLVVRETSRSEGRHVPWHVLRRTALVSGATLLVLTGVVVLFAGHRFNLYIMLPLGLLAIGNLVLVLVSAANRGIGRLQAGQVPELLLRPTLFLGLIGGAALFSHFTSSRIGFVSIIYLLVTAYSVAGLIAGVLLRRGLASRPELPHEAPEGHWQGSFFRLGLIGWLAVGNAQLLIILTGVLADYMQVGLFRVATQAVSIMGIGLTAIETVQAPAYSSAWKHGNMRSLHQLLQQSCLISVAISFGVMFFLIVAGRPLLGWLFGDSFTAAFPALCVLAGGQLLNALTGNVGILLIASRRERKLIFGNFAALAITMIASWLLIPQYGAIAASVASAIGLTLRNVFAFCICYLDLGLVAFPFAKFSIPCRSSQ